MSPIALRLLFLFALVSCRTTGVDVHLFDSQPQDVQGGHGLNQYEAPRLSSFADLGLENVGQSFGGRIDIPQENAHTTLKLISCEYAGTGILTGDYTYEHEHIPTGSQVATEFDFTWASWQHTWDLLPSDNWDLGLGLGLGYLSLQTGIEDITPGGTGSSDGDDGWIPAATLAGRLAYHNGPLSVSASLEWLASSLELGSLGQVDAELGDADFLVSYTVFQNSSGGLGLHAGFRDSYVITNISENEEYGNAGIEYRQAYPYFGLSLFF